MRVHLVAFLDDHSRFVTGFGLASRASGEFVIEVMRSAIQALRWWKPGTVWAMDFTEFPCVLEGGMKYGLAIRDLSSRCSQELLVTDVADSKTVIDLLSLLFALHGAPLAIKSDNGSAFASRDVVEFLKGAGVLLLLSPPHTPKYNGAVESGFYTFSKWPYSTQTSSRRSFSFGKTGNI